MSAELIRERRESLRENSKKKKKERKEKTVKQLA